ncbi:hypothetical protein AVEN_210947-1 [Araneus ventricosus]|uniref:Methyltransferase domain-containing protein n=1 Tax=Araneus ventricosus TaxID=182803 RepID=A0A4Y2DGH1_ARAVE|nr:hypothetical protein AVEN_210947-1 [Araneus ventricosus]
MDLKLCEFYFETISKLIGKENRRENLKQIRLYLNRFPSSPDSSNFSSKTRKGKERRLLRETLCYRIAYIYRNSLCISSAVVHHFENVLNQNANHIRQLWQKNCILRICSLGGGSPSDVVAIVKVLESNLAARVSGDMQVTIVDMNGSWKSTCITVLQSLERFKHSNGMISFIEADISSFGDEVTNAIQNAHIVSMVKFISESQGGTRKKMAEFRKNLFQKVCELVQPGSLFLLLDCPQNGLVDICGGDTGLIPESRTVCNEPEHSHKLDSAALQRHSRLYDKLFRSANYNSSLELFARVWIKTEEPPLTDSVFLKAICGKYEDFKKRLILKKKARSSQLQRSGDSATKNWKQLFATEMKDSGWNRKKIRKAITAVEREVIEKSKK